MKVIAFDSWTIGAFHFKEIASLLKSKNINFELIHTGSWGNDKKNDNISTHYDFLAKDIRFYNTNDIEIILKKECPDLVIFLSLDTFTHRAFNIYCKQKKIPTILLYHGLIAIQDNDSGGSFKLNFKSQAEFIYKRLLKLIFFVLPNYALCLVRTKKQLSYWLNFLKDIFRIAFSSNRNSKLYYDSQTDKVCIYTKADLIHCMETYKITEEKISIVGNPDLNKFKLKESDFLAYNISTSAKEIIYIETGLIYVGYVFESIDEYIKHLVNTRDKVRELGLDFSVKLKPMNNDKYFQIIDQLQSNGINCIENNDLINRLRNCKACIVEPSTITLIPCLMGLPVLKAKYDKLDKVKYGEIINKYPNSYDLVNLNILDSVLQKINSNSFTDCEKMKNWFNENSGPLPSSEMPNRVVENIVKLISNK